MKKTVVNNKADSSATKPTFQPETSHKKALSIYGGSAKTVVAPTAVSTSKSNSQQAKKVPIIVDASSGSSSKSQTKVSIKTATVSSQKDASVTQSKEEKLKELFAQLPQEIVLQVLDYYVGSGFKACFPRFEKLANTNFKEAFEYDSLSFDESMFYKQYFGKFKNRGDTNPKPIFWRSASENLVDLNRISKEFHYLLSLQI
ncbi:predicted protein [Naegleria gruberi]|uniref:Predicted protein n=1 Tax=Naegleria gruberi TaxID=5762 RepID=D2VB20_NAEGR|nr:uncharacterized protein NAEGRDRAFT_66058 [Naegleria gruberi]EFC46047.1 predicted protein [Naegleria gruberi]|eukprot:XP_002678791.1 predicted protein [Naegleria gruberi strain NEG-M]